MGGRAKFRSSKVKGYISSSLLYLIVDHKKLTNQTCLKSETNSHRRLLPDGWWFGDWVIKGYGIKNKLAITK